MANTENVQRKSAARQAADLLDKVTKIHDATESIVETAANVARLKQLNKMAKLVATAEPDVQAAYFRLIGKKEGAE